MTYGNLGKCFRMLLQSVRKACYGLGHVSWIENISVNSGVHSFATHHQCPQIGCVSLKESMCSAFSFPHISLIWETILLWAMCRLLIRPKRCHDTNLVMNWLLVGLHVVEYQPSVPKSYCVCHKESIQSRTWTKSWTAFMVIGCDEMKSDLSHPRGFWYISILNSHDCIMFRVIQTTATRRYIIGHKRPWWPALTLWRDNLGYPEYSPAISKLSHAKFEASASISSS